MQNEIIPSYAQYDYYDLHMADDIQGSGTALTDGAPQNWIAPLPFEIDVQEAMVVKAIKQYVEDSALDDIANRFNVSETETFRSHFFFFKPTETTIGNNAYQDEIKEAVATITHVNQARTTASNMLESYELEKQVTFQSPLAFPLNVALKTVVGLPATPSIAIFSEPEYWYQRYHYRIGRTQEDFLRRVVKLLRQEIV